MAEQFFQFGDRETADVKLQLIGEDGDEEKHIYLHSQVLKKSEFYDAWLSPRWSLDERPRELKISTSVSLEIYVKFFQLMYSCAADERFYFSGVDEALAILPIASQMLFSEGIEQCMKYLDAVRWSPEQEAKLRAMLSSLQINILPELASRLGMSQDKSDTGNLELLKQTLEDMLSTISDRSNNGLSLTEVEEYIVGFFEAAKTSSAKAVADTCRSALLEEFHANINRIKLNEFNGAEERALSDWTTLLWLFDVIRRCDSKLYHTFIQMFCNDGHLRDSAKYSRVGGKVKVDILLDRTLNAMGNGEIITPGPFRLSFLTNWLDALATLIADHPMGGDKWAALERGIMAVADTLPLADQKLIYNLWKDVFNRLSIEPSNALKWWAEKVQNAIKNGKII